MGGRSVANALLLRSWAILSASWKMISMPTSLKAFALVSSAGSLFAFFSMIACAALSGVTPEAIWWSRIYVWWVDFFLAGSFLMLAVYLWRKSERLAKPTVCLRPRLRVALFLLGQLLLTGGLYCADFAWYLRNREINDVGEGSGCFSTFAWVLLVGALVAFWCAWRRTGNCLGHNRNVSDFSRT